ncbi:MAG: hypothetical protein PHG75_04700 [Syntrophomonas sp.]|nr:hypothetical protein [Syntrophomonas sp.]
MKCPQCDTELDPQGLCPHCGLDVSGSDWVVIATVNPPDDALLESLIKSFGIPVQLIKPLGSVFGLAVGPLGEVKVAVPEAFAARTEQLLQAEMEGSESDL